MIDRLFYWMLRRRWNLTALDLCVSYALDVHDWDMDNKQAHLRAIQRDVLAAKR